MLLIHSSSLRSTLVLACPLSPHALRLQLAGRAGAGSWGCAGAGAGKGEEDGREWGEGAGEKAAGEQGLMVVVDRVAEVTAQVDHYRTHQDAHVALTQDQSDPSAVSDLWIVLSNSAQCSQIQAGVRLCLSPSPFSVGDCEHARARARARAHRAPALRSLCTCT